MANTSSWRSVADQTVSHLAVVTTERADTGKGLSTKWRNQGTGERRPPVDWRLSYRLAGGGGHSLGINFSSHHF